MNRIAHVLIRGQVQGVGFRAWLRHHAELNGLEGWVRNRRDGAVEALLSGPDSLVDAMLKACRQGPAGSHVQSVDMLPDPSTLDSSVQAGRFEVLPTA
jgi:acylphosphatase